MKRVMITFEDEAAETIRRLARRNGLSVAETARRSVALFQFVTRLLEDGAVFYVKTANGSEERVNFFWEK